MLYNLSNKTNSVVIEIAIKVQIEVYDIIIHGIKLFASKQYPLFFFQQFLWKDFYYLIIKMIRRINYYGSSRI
ncbi:MAG: hypothetical protein BAJALOKI2v1_430009 [Promethearchaeota archaeon]|nr:MAG: hypothetical protein BAJALOKI2v1_430009 [Candidatus Lokiarchaeota archaeon]